jgi:hypothetical protein
MDEIFPEATHRYYARHIYVNLKNKGFRGLEMKIEFFWYNKSLYKSTIQDLLKGYWRCKQINLGSLNNIHVET